MFVAKHIYLLRQKFFPSKSGFSLSPAFSMTAAILTMRCAIVQSSRWAVSATPDNSMAAVGHTSVKDGAIESLHSASQLRCERTVCREAYTLVCHLFSIYGYAAVDGVPDSKKCLPSRPFEPFRLRCKRFLLFEYPARWEIFHFR